VGIVVARTTIVVVVVVAPFRVGDATGRPRGRDAPTLTSTIASPRTVNLIGFAGSMVACVGVPRSDRSMPPRVRRLSNTRGRQSRPTGVRPVASSSCFWKLALARVLRDTPHGATTRRRRSTPRARVVRPRVRTDRAPGKREKPATRAASAASAPESRRAEGSSVPRGLGRGSVSSRSVPWRRFSGTRRRCRRR